MTQIVFFLQLFLHVQNDSDFCSSFNCKMFLPVQYNLDFFFSQYNFTAHGFKFQHCEPELKKTTS